MKTSLIFPPSCDPASPYISVPLLTGFLRAHGIEVLPIDANVEAYRHILVPGTLSGMVSDIRKRFRKLDNQDTLTHEEQLEYGTLFNALTAGTHVPEHIGEAFRIVTDKTDFYDDRKYGTAVDIFTRALSVISAAYWPLDLDFAWYRTKFSLLSRKEVEYDAQSGRNPFHDYFSTVLIGRLKQENVRVAGISVVFPGQIQPAFSLGLLIRKMLPDVHVTAGGPALTQFMGRLSGTALENACAPFHTVITGEGEQALLDLIHALTNGEKASGIRPGRHDTDIAKLPAPDFDGLPLDSYFSPEPVLPYDASRGCYWGRCAFCHYGLSGCGTAPYRERDSRTAAAHLIGLSRKHGARLFYLSEDAITPAFLRKLAGILKTEAPDIKWSTDIRAEPSLTPETCIALSEGGALSVSVGVESGSDRVLSFMDKGIRTANARKAVRNLSEAGIAAEVMCFTGFPTETFNEALMTLSFLSDLREHISLFMCGEFALMHGSRVAGSPRDYGIDEIWEVRGDEYRTALFYRMNREYMTAHEKNLIEAKLDRISEFWSFGRYPWAGSLSTAHTQLWYDRFGRNAFKRPYRVESLPDGAVRARYNIDKIGSAFEQEAEIWNILIHEYREVTRTGYAERARRLPLLRNRGGRRRER